MLCKDMSPFTILNLNFPKNLCAAQIITSNDLGWRQKSLRRTSKPAFPLSHSFTRQTKGGLWGMWTRKKKKKLLCIQSAVELRLGESGAAGRRVNAATQPGSCRTDSLCSHSASIQKEIKTRWRWRSREKYLAENIRCTVYASSESSLWSQIMI